MNKSLLTLVAGLLSVIAVDAQLLEVQSMERVSLPEGMKAEQALLSPDGSRMAFSDFDGKLKLLERSARRVDVISSKGSMLDLSFTGNGRTIVYRENSYDSNHRRFVSVNAFDVVGRKSECIVAPTRNLEALDVRNGIARTVEGGRAKSKALSATQVAKSWPVLSFDRGLLYITENDERRLASYLGTDGMSYIWASISPSGERMVFFAAGYGTYTCKLDGSDMHKLGYLYAPVWYDDNTVIGMVTENDGVVTYKGNIVASDYKGTEWQTLTDDHLVAVLPSAAPGRICFTTTDGEAYIMNIKQ